MASLDRDVCLEVCKNLQLFKLYSPKTFLVNRLFKNVTLVASKQFTGAKISMTQSTCAIDSFSLTVSKPKIKNIISFR